jgi:hypothetical protein
MMTMVTAKTALETPALETLAPPERKRKRDSHSLAPLRLSVPQDIPGYYIRWVNDNGVEVEYRLQNDYEFVAPAEVGLMHDTESKVHRVVGTRENGDALHAYLMKIRQEWRDQDVHDEGELQRRFEQQIRRGTVALGGQSEATRYDAGIHIEDRTGRKRK